MRVWLSTIHNELHEFVRINGAKSLGSAARAFRATVAVLVSRRQKCDRCYVSLIESFQIFDATHEH
jgi:hypothetical protein